MDKIKIRAVSQWSWSHAPLAYQTNLQQEAIMVLWQYCIECGQMWMDKSVTHLH
jgi:hypothetical protein